MDVNQLKTNLVRTIRAYNKKGWSPATSTNYSFKDESNRIWVTRSGIDKSEITEDDFMLIDEHGQTIEPSIEYNPSAETLIHCCIYSLFPDTKVILHSHGKYPLLTSEKAQHHVTLKGWEVQKGFEGVPTHDTEVCIPIVANSQNMEDIEIFLKEFINEINHHCFIIKGHGTYAWGNSLFAAKRHLETLDYLCEISWEMNKK
jgi:methylthioribulose-1-phosphate dehydratase